MYSFGIICHEILQNCGPFSIHDEGSEMTAKGSDYHHNIINNYAGIFEKVKQSLVEIFSSFDDNILRSLTTALTSSYHYQSY